MRAFASCGTVAALFGLLAVADAVAEDRITDQLQACEVLKKAAVELHLSRHDLSGRYYCEANGDNSDVFILGLRYITTADEMVGSNLLGWFAVRRTDGTVLEWDFEQNQAIPLRPRPPFEQ